MPDPRERESQVVYHYYVKDRTKLKKRNTPKQDPLIKCECGKVMAKSSLTNHKYASCFIYDDC